MQSELVGQRRPPVSIRFAYLLAGFGLFALMWGLGTTSARAAVFCVQTTSQLADALSLSRFNFQGNEIRLRQGTYDMPNGTGTVSLNGILEYSHDLEISGGWNIDCSHRNINPNLTTINGQTSSGSKWSLRSNSSILIDGLRFFNTSRISISNPLKPKCEFNGQKITIRRSRFDSSVASPSLEVDSECHQVTIENSLVNNAGAVGIQITCQAFLVYRVINTTIVESFGWGMILDEDFSNPCISHQIGANGLYNNVIDKLLLDESRPLARNNIFDSVMEHGIGELFSGSSDNLFVDPQLDADYRPIEPGSPAINSGTDNVPGGLPATDIEGNPRDIGGIPDRGAYESSVVPAGPFVLTVTSSADSGAGTLRDVLGQANGISGLNLIQFDIPGDCPRLITLAMPLPDITEPVIINGFSQPGASFNSLENGNNSVLCVGVRASIFADVPYALRVPPTSSAALKVRGMGFGGFDDGGGLLGEAAIFLQGGSGHQIQGNQFSGAFHATTLPASNEGVRLMNNATNALIGGTSPSLRNTFSHSNIAAIQIFGTGPDNHRIINNYIGTTPSGLAAAGNFDGIRIIQSGGNHVLDNLISGNTRDGIYISGAQATGNVVGNNRIGGTRPSSFQFCGPAPLPPCSPPLTNRKGVFIDNDATNNTIGPGSFVGGPNRIRYSTQHGVRVLSGQRNRILNNSLFDNGTDANELDIDIEAFGLGPIDADCGASADGKANRGQNRPVIDTAQGNGTTLSVTGSLSSCTNTGGFTAVYRLQFFASSSCAANGYGPGQYFIGDHNILLDGANETDVTEAFSAELEHPWLNIGGKYITATATDIFGNTSEFSQCVQATISDVLFSDRFEQP